jgi:phospholipid/cholesterol/gamma-HCH transport system substrate-binding protein
MMTHEQKTRLGVFLTLATVLFLTVAGFFIVPKLRDIGTVYAVNFHNTSVQGLIVGSLVKYRGVEVGRVVRIRVNPTDLDSILVDVKIREGVAVKADMTALLAFVGLTGQKYIEISGGTLESPDLPAHGEISTGRGLGEKADDIIKNFETTAQRITEVLSPENVAKFSAFLDNAEKSSSSLTGILQSRRQSLENTLTSFEKASADFARATEKFAPLTEDLDRLVRSIESSSQATLGNISRRFSDEELGQVIKDVRDFLGTASVSLKKVESVLLEQQADLEKTFANLGLAVENLARFSRQIADEPSSILRLRKDKK